MARSIDDIRQAIITEKESSPTLDGLTSTSKASVWGEWVNNIAFAHLVLEQNFDQHALEMQDLIANQKKGSALWYRNMALAFQYGYGFNLIPDSDQFDNANHTDEEIEASKIVKYAAVTEAEEESRLVIKIATDDGNELQPITEEQKEAFTAYIAEVKYAGVQVSVINFKPDILKLDLVIYRDPLILDENGTSIANGKTPVNDAVHEYLKNLPFNGELVLAHLVDQLQLIPGVKIPDIVSASSKAIDATTNGYGSFEELTVRRIPASGYFSTNEEDVNWLNVSYVV